VKKRADITVINYDNLPWIRANVRGTWPYRTVIADESTRLKGFRLRNGGVRAASLAKPAKLTRRWLNLTGTPNGNGFQDLWGQQWFIDFGKRLGLTHEAFMKRWFVVDEHTRSVGLQYGAEAELLSILADCTISLNAKDWLDLPELIENDLYVDLPPKAALMYKNVKKEFYAQLTQSEHINAANAGVKTMKLLQIASGAVFVQDVETNEPTGGWLPVHDEKLDALEDILEEANGENILVAYQFTHERDRILKRFKQARAFDGSKKMENDWNEGKIRVLLAHPKSAGHGLNLQDGGRIIAFFGHWWSFEQRAQIIERLGPTRQLQAGHPRTVFVHNILARGTVDELVMARQRTQQDILTLLLNAMKEEV
jgi:SNF2 family DNA or RNA helicase